MINNKLVLKTWKGNKNGSITLTLPAEFTRPLSLDIPSHVIVEVKGDGILIKKLSV